MIETLETLDVRRTTQFKRPVAQSIRHHPTNSRRTAEIDEELNLPIQRKLFNTYCCLEHTSFCIDQKKRLESRFWFIGASSLELS
jgi:hypothetical protein